MELVGRQASAEPVRGVVKVVRPIEGKIALHVSVDVGVFHEPRHCGAEGLQRDIGSSNARDSADGVFRSGGFPGQVALQFAAVICCFIRVSQKFHRNVGIRVTKFGAVDVATHVGELTSSTCHLVEQHNRAVVNFYSIPVLVRC